LASLLIALINACKKQNIDPLSQLPPATQTGARTFGCLVNGQAFVAKGTSIYDPVGISEYYNGRTFNIKGGHKNSDGSITGLDIDIDSVNLVVGQTYTIKLNSGKRKGDGFGRYSYFGTNNNIYNTNDVVSGEVTITSLANATAGTFYFNAVNDKGDTVKITNGRFDW
jgi:hypothetical protein